MEENEFSKLADAVFKRLITAIDAHDAEDIEVDRAGDVLTIVLRGAKKCILNTQKPTRQLWLACGTTAWHFDYRAGVWQDDKGRGALDAILAEIIQKESGLAITL
jgi:CyaY protein